MSNVKYYISQDEFFVSETIEQKIGEVVPGFNSGNVRQFETWAKPEYVGFRVINVSQEQANRIFRILTGWKIHCIIEP